jgi:hypothetical protein
VCCVADLPWRDRVALLQTPLTEARIMPMRDRLSSKQRAAAMKTVSSARRRFSQALLLRPVAPQVARAQPNGGAPRVKTLRCAFRVAESGFYPAQVDDIYSSNINANILDAPLTSDFLARPARAVPNPAEGLPDISSDFRTLANKLLVAYAPCKFVGHRIETPVMRPWVLGFQRHPFMRDFWKYVDIDHDALDGNHA